MPTEMAIEKRNSESLYYIFILRVILVGIVALFEFL